MREVINISVTRDLNRAIDSLVKKGKYSTKSEFLRDIIRDKLAEVDMLRRLEISKKEVAQGKVKILKSLSDLD